jgi:NADH dehydrogenase (ubiquinone) Fe-S protein 1
MCLVEIEKSPKPIASCAFPVSSNIKIFTESALVQKARENVLEFLLLNHPLDCPICDQGGECDLQEQTLAFGSDRNRFSFSKRGVQNKNCGPLIKTIMTRCIHCTRCVRFLQDIAGSGEFGITLRGKEAEIGTYIEKNLISELSGNIIDLCPVGALTSKPYAFSARPWEIKSIETIDILDSIGSNIKINFKETEILRVLPLSVDNINEDWISDKTRFFFDAIKIQRLGYCFQNIGGHFQKTSWKKILDLNIFSKIGLSQLQSQEILFVCGNNLDLKVLVDLKNLAFLLGVKLIPENFSALDSNLMPNFKLNTIFNDILMSDACLTVGSNVRFEASLLNIRIKKRTQIGDFLKASIGLCENFTFLNNSLGHSSLTFMELAEGSHFFCKNIIRSKMPFLILGSTVKKRIDSSVNNLLLSVFCKNIAFITKNWFGLNFLSNTSSNFAENFLGFHSENKLRLDNKKLIYCISLEFYENLFSKISKTDNFITAQTPFADFMLKKVDLILPSTLFLEKDGFFINLEGYLQKTEKGLTGPSLSRDDSNILRILKEDLLLSKTFLNSKNILQTSLTKTPNKFFLNILDNKKIFTKSLFTCSKKHLKKIYKTSFKLFLPNFFSSNIFTKFSITLSKCCAILVQNYSNFISK